MAKLLVNECKQRVSLCHIGLLKDRGGHLINQPCGPAKLQILQDRKHSIILHL